MQDTALFNLIGSIVTQAVLDAAGVAKCEDGDQYAAEWFLECASIRQESRDRILQRWHAANDTRGARKRTRHLATRKDAGIPKRKAA